MNLFVHSYFFVFVLFMSSALAGSIVVVGGGPVGLATAIEAKESGQEVIVIEKREEYVRPQTVFLDNSSLELLEKWKVESFQMHVVLLEDNKRMAFIRLRYLEEALAERASQLGVRRLLGEFKDFKKDEKLIIVSTKTGEIELPYDILIGADGPHSQVREKAGIQINRMGVAVGIAAGILHEPPSGTFEITSPVQKNGYFMRKIATPAITIIFAQTSCHPTISQNDLEKLVMENGWKEEAQAFAENKVKISDTFEIFLQQADSYSNFQTSVILVGDAAATASFFEGMGLNTGMQTAALAGEFFKSAQDKRAYDLFDQKAKEVADVLIDKNKYLFIK